MIGHSIYTSPVFSCFSSIAIEYFAWGIELFIIHHTALH